MGEIVYEDYEKMIAERAWSFTKSYRVPFEELKSEGYVIFLTTAQIFDSTKAKFSTFFYIRLNQGFLNFCTQWRSQLPEYYTEIGVIDLPVVTPQIHSFWDKVKTLSKEAEAVVIAITEGPEEIYQAIQTKPPKMVRGVVVTYLRKEKGWSWPKIWKTFTEIKQWVRKEV